MELSRKYKALLLRSKLNPITLHKCRKLCKESKDIELVIIHDKVTNELKKRGLINE